MSEALVEVPLPPNTVECDVCMNDECNDGESFSEEEAKIKLKRCSVCKNQFYCSQKCQKKDWKEHKFHCSPLNGPTGGILNKSVVAIEIMRMTEFLAVWAEDFKTREKGSTAPSLSSALQESVLPALPGQLDGDAMHPYPYKPKDSTKFIYRLPLTHLCRLFLTDLVTNLDSKGKDKLSKFLLGAQFPSGWPQPYGPKVVARPADLSPGEYEMLPQMIGIFAIGSDHSDLGGYDFDEERKNRWVNLKIAMDGLWNLKA